MRVISKIETIRGLTVGLLCAALSTGCYQLEDDERSARTSRHALTALSDCDEVESALKKAAAERMRSKIEEARQSAIEQCSWRWEGGPGEFETDTHTATDTDDWVGEGDDVADSGDAPAAGEGEGEGEGEAPNSDGDEAPDHSKTNTQEEEVDEADIVKTDGNHIYALRGSELVIVSVDEAGSLAVEGRLEVAGRAAEMFLGTDKIIVFGRADASQVPSDIHYSSSSSNRWNDWDTAPDIDTGGDWPGGDWSEPYYGDGAYTKFTVIDISNRQKPTAIIERYYAGEYVSARLTGGAVRAVLSTSLALFQSDTWVDPWEFCRMSPEQGRSELDAAFDALIEENERRILALDLDEALPKQIAVRDGQTGASEPISRCDAVYAPNTAAGTGLLSVVSMELDDPDLGGRNVSIIGDKGLVYSTVDSLYLTTDASYVKLAASAGLWEEETSGIHKFDISNNSTTVSYLATGTVDGHMLDQFCLGEHRGFLRVATTTGSPREWSEEGRDNTLDNHLTILEESGGELVEVSRLDDIGRGEEIYAARFMGERGFIVTFLETDPLFTFDLSDPYAPKVVGEWKGPGYSTYLHPRGENQLLSMGWDEGISLSLYDLTDFAQPALDHRLPLREVVSGNWVESVALQEHKAITFAPDGKTFALPYHVWSSRFETGLLLFSFEPHAISFEGRLNLEAPGSEDYEAMARRAVFIGQNVFAVSNCRISSASVDDLSDPVSSIALYSGQRCDDFDAGDPWGGGDTAEPVGSDDTEWTDPATEGSTWPEDTEGTGATGGWDTGTEREAPTDTDL